MNHLAKNIRLLRKKSSKRQEDIGFLVHKGQTTIGNWETGKSQPNIEELLVISNFFDISVDILLKVDLAKTNFLPPERRKKKTAPTANENKNDNTVKYNHNEWESLVKEHDEKILSDILREIRSLRQEFKETVLLPKTEPKTGQKAG
jgi:transcriptional regulator with XRE-family HTH domain